MREICRKSRDKRPNKITGANSRLASPRNAGWQFGCALCAPSLQAAAVAQFCRWASIRLTLPFVCLLFGGCAVFFTESDRELGVIQPKPGTNVVIRAVLPRDARSIRFTSAKAVPTGQGEQRVAVTLANTSTRTIELGPGSASALAPHSSVQLFEGSLSVLLTDRQFSVSTWSGRASIELHVQFASAPSLDVPIRILCWRSSPPL